MNPWVDNMHHQHCCPHPGPWQGPNMAGSEAKATGKATSKRRRFRGEGRAWAFWLLCRERTTGEAAGPWLGRSGCLLAKERDGGVWTRLMATQMADVDRFQECSECFNLRKGEEKPQGSRPRDTDLPWLTMGSCPNKPIVSWRYCQVDSAFNTPDHGLAPPTSDVLRTWTLAYSWAPSSNTKPILE